MLYQHKQSKLLSEKNTAGKGRLQYKISNRGKSHWKVDIWSRTQSGEEKRETHTYRKRIPGSENSKHKALKVGKYLAYLKGNEVTIADQHKTQK